MRIWFGLAIFVAFGCASGPPPVPRAAFAQREAEFHDLMEHPLRHLEDAENLVGLLEVQRLRHLGELSKCRDDIDADLLVLRIAEMHLATAARIRRLPYPDTTSWNPSLVQQARTHFDRELAQLALPLEATGLAIVGRMAQRSDPSPNRYIVRARLYQRLHQQLPLRDSDKDALRRERSLSAYAAPRALLEAGRLGQRSARSH
jgi:hypothetical protein